MTGFNPLESPRVFHNSSTVTPHCAVTLNTSTVERSRRRTCHSFTASQKYSLRCFSRLWFPRHYPAPRQEIVADPRGLRRKPWRRAPILRKGMPAVSPVGAMMKSQVPASHYRVAKKGWPVHPKADRPTGEGDLTANRGLALPVIYLKGRRSGNTCLGARSGIEVWRVFEGDWT